jgi:hypothetical protein
LPGGRGGRGGIRLIAVGCGKNIKIIFRSIVILVNFMIFTGFRVVVHLDDGRVLGGRVEVAHEEHLWDRRQRGVLGTVAGIQENSADPEESSQSRIDSCVSRRRAAMIPGV